MKIPILIYHALFHKTVKKEKYALSGEDFERQIQYLSEEGFQSLSLDDFWKPHNHTAPDRKGVVITFDDGNLSDYSIAFPILKKYGFTATFFATVNWISTENYVTWSHLKEMVSENMSVQSHSLSHSFLSDLNLRDLYKELRESKNMLEENLNIPVTHLSLPGGFCSKKVFRMAKDLTYRGVCTSMPGLNTLNSQAREFVILNRFLITRETSFNHFKAIIDKDRKYIASQKTQYYLKLGMKKILGSKRYYKIWSTFFRE